MTLQIPSFASNARAGPEPCVMGYQPWAKKLRRVQKLLERFYGLEQGPNVVEFVRLEDGAREELLVRQTAEHLEIALVLPRDLAHLRRAPAPEDCWLQVLEGVSHFVYVAERARTGLPITQLELELQAEVDKFVLLVQGPHAFDALDAHELCSLLYDRVEYLHAPHTETGERYRLANFLAARFIRHLLTVPAPDFRIRLLRRFYRSGQTEKIVLARTA